VHEHQPRQPGDAPAPLGRRPSKPGEEDQHGEATVEGYVVDIACLRRYPETEYAKRSRAHTTGCVADGSLRRERLRPGRRRRSPPPLDTHATPHVVAVLREASTTEAVYLVVERTWEDGEMVTQQVQRATKEATGE
jgi:hypothetical protein